MNNKKQIRLTESDLKQIVKESVNKVLSEAYGTMNAQDSADMARLDNPYSDYVPKENRYNSGKDSSYDVNKIMELWHYLNDFNYDSDTVYYLHQINQNYAEAIMKHIDKARILLEKIIKIAKMNMGQQPDKLYNWKDELATGYLYPGVDDDVRINASKHKV